MTTFSIVLSPVEEIPRQKQRPALIYSSSFEVQRRIQIHSKIRSHSNDYIYYHKEKKNEVENDEETNEEGYDYDSSVNSATHSSSSSSSEHSSPMNGTKSDDIEEEHCLRKHLSLPIFHNEICVESIVSDAECNSPSYSDLSLEESSPLTTKEEEEDHKATVENDFLQSDNLKNLKMLWNKGFISETEFQLRKRQLTEIDEPMEEENHVSRHEIARRLVSHIMNHPPPNFNKLKPIKALKHMFDSTMRKWTSQTIIVKIDPEPFAKGGLRMVYHLQDLSLTDPAMECQMTFVAKTAIDQSEDPATYFRDVEMQALASSYAQLYNSYNPPRRVEFLPAWILQLPVDIMDLNQMNLRNTNISSSNEGKGRLLENFSYGYLDKRKGKKHMFFGVEPYITGDYHKHNNNYGYVSDLERNTPQAFSHFTYEASNNEILVVDIQGVKDHYTDPQIHTRSGREFGKGNLSLRGFRRFLDSHRCNAICRYLKLPLVNPNDITKEKGTLPAQAFMNKAGVEHVSTELRHYYDQSAAFKKHAIRNLNRMENSSYANTSKCAFCGSRSGCILQ